MDEEILEAVDEEEDDFLLDDGEAEDHHSDAETEAAGDQGAQAEDHHSDAGASEGTQAEAGEKYTLTINHEAREVSREELISLAQKGAGYDQLKARTDNAEAEHRRYMQEKGELVSLLESMAKDSGMGAAEFLTTLRAQQLVDHFVEKGMDPNSAKIAAQERAQREAAERRAPKAETAQDRFTRESGEFIQKYQVDPSKIPQEVFNRFNRGENFTAAYEAVMGQQKNQDMSAEIERLKKELAAAQQNNKNKQRSIGSQKSTGGSKGYDVFAAALLNDD